MAPPTPKASKIALPCTQGAVMFDDEHVRGRVTMLPRGKSGVYFQATIKGGKPILQLTVRDFFGDSSFKQRWVNIALEECESIAVFQGRPYEEGKLARYLEPWEEILGHRDIRVNDPRNPGTLLNVLCGKNLRYYFIDLGKPRPGMEWKGHDDMGAHSRDVEERFKSAETVQCLLFVDPKQNRMLRWTYFLHKCEQLESEQQEDEEDEGEGENVTTAADGNGDNEKVRIVIDLTDD